MKKVHERRFENLIKATLEAPKEQFNMGMFTHDCGSPACLLGNYGNRTDLQRTFVLTKMRGSDSNNRLFLRLRNKPGAYVLEYGSEICEHFGITMVEADDLFSTMGCNNAQADKTQAIKYVRAFVKRKKASQQ
jgi:hypothetical protein